MCCIADLQKNKPLGQETYTTNIIPCQCYIIINTAAVFLWREATFFLVAESLSLTCQILLLCPIIPPTTKDNFVDYVSYYVLLFSKLQPMLAWGGLRTLVNINETIWGTSSPESKLCLHQLCCVASLNMGKLPLTFNYRCLNNTFFPWQSKVLSIKEGK